MRRAFRLMWGVLLGVLALMAFGACSRLEPSAGACAAQAAAATAARSPVVLLAVHAAEPARCQQGHDVSPVHELATLEREDIEDDARSQALATSISARLTPLTCSELLLPSLRSVPLVTQPCRSTALPRGPPAA
jgi:hypothetical protein